MDIVGPVILTPLLELSYNEYDADDECDDLLDISGADGKVPNSLM